MEKMKIIEITEEEVKMMKSFDYDDELKYYEEITKEKNIGEKDGNSKQ